MDTFAYFAVNKPVGYSASLEGEHSIKELLTETHHAGKYLQIEEELPTPHIATSLDTDAEGLILLTNDHGLIEKIRNKEHEYEITIDNYLTKDAVKILKKGIVIKDTFVPGITILEEKHKGNRSVVRATMSEITASNIRDMFEKIGYHVTAVKCVRIGEVKLGTLSIGKWKFIPENLIT